LNGRLPEHTFFAKKMCLCHLSADAPPPAAFHHNSLLAAARLANLGGKVLGKGAAGGRKGSVVLKFGFRNNASKISSLSKINIHVGIRIFFVSPTRDLSTCFMMLVAGPNIVFDAMLLFLLF
jgi:hypothetical protein